MRSDQRCCVDFQKLLRSRRLREVSEMSLLIIIVENDASLAVSGLLS